MVDSVSRTTAPSWPHVQQSRVLQVSGAILHILRGGRTRCVSIWLAPGDTLQPICNHFPVVVSELSKRVGVLLTRAQLFE